MLSSGDNECVTLSGERPWLPFCSKKDFEFTELTHSAALSKDQVDSLAKLIKRCKRNPRSFTFEGVQDVKHSWEDASRLLTPVHVFHTTSVHS